MSITTIVIGKHSTMKNCVLTYLSSKALHGTGVEYTVDGVDELWIVSEGLWRGALGITELAEGRRAGLIDPHQQPVQPHHWSSVHPVLDVLYQTGGRGEAGEAGADQRGAVRGHGGLGLAQEDSATEERLAELPAVTTPLVIGFLDLKPKLPFNIFRFLSLQVLCM